MVAARVTTEQFSVTPTSVRLGVYLFRSRTPQRQPDTAPLPQHTVHSNSATLHTSKHALYTSSLLHMLSLVFNWRPGSDCSLGILLSLA